MTPRPPHGTGRPLTEYWQQQGLIAVVEYKGLPRYPLSKKLNVCWWFGNEMEQQLADAPWYRPEWPEWRRRFYWLYLRNPLQNFRAVVIGEARPYPVALVMPAAEPADARHLELAIARANSRLPDYAQVRRHSVLPKPLTFADGLLTANGRPRRDAISQRYAPLIERLYETALAS